MSEKTSWQPGASNALLRYRSDLYRKIRQFFHTRDVLEVITPSLGATGVTDLYVKSLKTSNSEHPLYLQTSPECYMKRLLAADSGPIYQICPAFRQDESGRFHNQEFSLLEWYRPGLSSDELMTEVEDLVGSLASTQPFQKHSYKELFEQQFKINPHSLDSDSLLSMCRRHFASGTEHLQSPIDDRSRENCLDMMFSRLIQPNLKSPCFVTHFPSSQAAMAETALFEGDQVALRFELFWEGVELANGYQELRDASVLALRMQADNKDRLALGLEQVPADNKLLQAMESGLPASSGVALGLDRLIMILTASQDLDQVLAFTTERL